MSRLKINIIFIVLASVSIIPAYADCYAMDVPARFGWGAISQSEGISWIAFILAGIVFYGFLYLIVRLGSVWGWIVKKGLLSFWVIAIVAAIILYNCFS